MINLCLAVSFIKPKFLSGFPNFALDFTSPLAGPADAVDELYPLGRPCWKLGRCPAAWGGRATDVMTTTSLTVRLVSHLRRFEFVLAAKFDSVELLALLAQSVVPHIASSSCLDSKTEEIQTK